MEEKERYKYYEKINQIYDEENDELYAYLNTNKVISILNQQDKRIKELEEENKQLKQSQKQFAISEIEKVKNSAEKLLGEFCNSWEYNTRAFRGHRHIEYYDLLECLDKQIKELKGEE